MNIAIRWILVPLAGYAGWFLAIILGSATGFILLMCYSMIFGGNGDGLGGSTASFIDTVVNALQFCVPSMAAVFMIISTTRTAPSHRRIVALVTLFAGSVMALYFGKLGVGSVLVFGLWNREWIRNPLASSGSNHSLDRPAAR